jgi:hypothetical protein
MEKTIFDTLEYYSFFDYSPHFEEIFAFLRRKTTRESLKATLMSLVRRKRLSVKADRYTLGEYINKNKWKEDRVVITRHKLQKAIRFLTLISMFSQIKLVGLSGSAAMANAKKEDDIDFFIITAQNRLWTGRLIAVLIASLFGRRKFNDPHAGDKLCLNLFFDAKDLKIGPKKRTYYVAHEVLQMKPIIDKNSTYQRFLEANKWVFELFPNAHDIRELDKQFFDDSWTRRLEFARSQGQEEFMPLATKVGDWLEKLAKAAQMGLINVHKTTEVISDTQLWFFPEDFESKLPNR